MDQKSRALTAAKIYKKSKGEGGNSEHFISIWELRKFLER